MSNPTKGSAITIALRLALDDLEEGAGYVQNAIDQVERRERPEDLVRLGTIAADPDHPIWRLADPDPLAGLVLKVALEGWGGDIIYDIIREAETAEWEAADRGLKRAQKQLRDAREKYYQAWRRALDRHERASRQPEQ